MNHVYFRNIESVLTINLANAQKNLKIAVAWFKNPNLFKVIMDRQASGVSVELILADDKSNFTDPKVMFQDLIDAGGVVSIIRYPPLMHHKFCIIDGSRLFTGSYNWTRNANRNHENVILSTELSLINAFKEEFDQLLSSVIRITNISSTTFHALVVTNLIDDIENSFDASSTHIAIAVDQQPEIPSVRVESDADEKFKLLLEDAKALYLQAKHNQALAISDKLIVMNANVAEVYDLIALTKWRQRDYKSVVEAATKALELDNLYYAAYNMLGIGYAGQRIISESIKNYAIYISKEPYDYTVYWNQAISFLELSEEPSFKNSMRNQYKRKFESVLETVINLTTQQEVTDQSYDLYSTRGQAYLAQDKYRYANNDLVKALTLYNASPKNQQDVHILREIKAALKDADWFLAQ